MLSSNRALTINDIENLQLPNATGDWNWDSVSQYINMHEPYLRVEKVYHRI
jgi:hypothetical protein